MIGPTGVGKTEIARRLARLCGSPFLKVEASKFTEVGYVGRDVESMVRDLTESAVDMVRREKQAEVRRPGGEQRRGAAPRPPAAPARPVPRPTPPPRTPARAAEQSRSTREKLREPAPRRRSSTRARWRSRCARRASPASRSSPPRASRRWTSTSRTCCPASSAAKTKRRRLHRPRSARGPAPGGAGAARGRRAGGARGRRARADLRHPLHRRDRQDRRPRGRPRPRRLAAKACSATSCPSSRARPSPPSTDPCAPTTSSSSRPAPSTCPSPPTSSPSCRAASRSASSSRPSPKTTSCASSPSRGAPCSASTRPCSPRKGSSSPSPRRRSREMARFAMEVNQATENIGARRLATILETVLEDLSFEGAEKGARCVRIDADEVRRRLAPSPRTRTSAGSSSEDTGRRGAPRPAAPRALALSALALAACGKRGDPLPPLPVRRRPSPSLKLAQRGDKLEIAYAAPRATTGGARLGRPRHRDPARATAPATSQDGQARSAGPRPGESAHRDLAPSAAGHDGARGRPRVDRGRVSDACPPWRPSSSARLRAVTP